MKPQKINLKSTKTTTKKSLKNNNKMLKPLRTIKIAKAFKNNSKAFQNRWKLLKALKIIQKLQHNLIQN